jgi:hypothetical protein
MQWAVLWTTMWNQLVNGNVTMKLMIGNRDVTMKLIIG